MHELAKAREELQNELESRAIEAIALAEVQPECRGRWLAQADAILWCAAELAPTTLAVHSKAAGSLLVYFRSRWAEELQAAVERLSKEYPHA